MKDFYRLSNIYNMGCTDSRHEDSIQIEENFIKPQVSRLGFNEIPSKQLDNKLHRYSRTNLITFPQIARAFKELRLDFHSFQPFYSLFLDENCSTPEAKVYKTKKIVCLAILLGLSSEEEKLNLLFMNYDEKISKILDKNEVERLVEDIIFIHLFAIPKYVLSVYPQERLLEQYLNKFIPVMNDLCVYYHSQIMKTCDIIGINQFKLQFRSKRISKLLNGQKLREYIFYKQEELFIKSIIYCDTKDNTDGSVEINQSIKTKKVKTQPEANLGLSKSFQND
jgi:hypothetical protein